MAAEGFVRPARAMSPVQVGQFQPCTFVHDLATVGPRIAHIQLPETNLPL